MSSSAGSGASLFKVRVNVIMQRKIECSFQVNGEMTTTVKHEMIASNVDNMEEGKKSEYIDGDEMY